MKDHIMRIPIRALAARTLRSCLVIVALTLFAAASSSRAQLVTLVDNSSVVRIDPYSQAGMFDWRVGGSSQLKQQWFWYRVGTSGREWSIDTISAPTITGVSANQATISYANSLFSVDVTYDLTGGSATAGLNESVRIINKNTDPLSAPLDFHFFQYSDFDLGGLTGGQSVTLYSSVFRALQSGLSGGAALETGSPNPNRREAALFSQTLTSLNDANPTILNNVLTAGPGDVTFAFQWDWAIEPGGSRIISKIKTVPEPSAMVLMALGLVAFTLRRARD